jgi:hypothetical protein
MKAIRVLGWVLIAGLGLCRIPAQANLRAPRRADGYLSGGLRVALPAGTVRLARESMRIVFPAFDSGTPFREATILVELVYDFENTADRELDLTAQFVAVDIRDLDARLNGAGVPSVLSPDNAEEAECLSRLATHRGTFLEPLYRPFLQALKPEASPAARFSAIFGHLPMGDGSAPEFKTAGLDLKLRPGRNSLSIRYHQRPYVAEFRYGYTAAWPARGFTGFDYLLYPARSWEADKDFRFSVSVEIPYYRGRFLVFPRWDEPLAKSNVELRAEKAVSPHVRILRGEFDRLPAEILTVLVWFDPQAAVYLSGR